MYLPGVAQAVVAIFVGFPFDTVKTRVQTQLCTDPWSCAKQILRNEGLVGFYRGVPAPLATLAIKRSIQYHIFESLDTKRGGSLSAALLSAAVGSVIGCPQNVVKIRMQSSEGNSNTLACAKSIYKNHGVMGFYKGFGANFLKDVTFGTLFLGSYSFLRRRVPRPLAGGLASVLTWTVLFPLDTFKTISQAQIRANKQTSLKSLVTSVTETHGVWGLWKGLSPVIVRVLPTALFSMTVYELTKSFLEKRIAIEKEAKKEEEKVTLIFGE